LRVHSFEFEKLINYGSEKARAVNKKLDERNCEDREFIGKKKN